MRRILTITATAILFGSVAPAIAQGNSEQAKDNWGQEVKECNLTNCYPGGTSRGAYVSQQAQDYQEPGYGYEIHCLVSPGNSDPAVDDNCQ